MSDPSVTVVIPSWNGRHLLETCLAALGTSTVAARVIVIDNGSHDGTPEWLARHYPACDVILNARNLGFAAAVNQGIRASSTEWLALLNNDAVPAPDWIEASLRAGSADTKIGSVAARMMFRDAPERVSSAGVRVDISGGAWDYLMGETRWPSEPVDVFGASGGAGLFRAAMLREVGLFEAQFFAYFEDVDLAWRARLRGWRSVLAPDSVVHHALSATSGESSQLKPYYLGRNKWRTIVRNFPPQGLRRYWPVIVCYEALAIGQKLAQADLAALRGRRDALREMPTLLRQRRAIQAGRCVDWGSIRRALSPVESPLTLRRRALFASRLGSTAPT